MESQDAAAAAGTSKRLFLAADLDTALKDAIGSQVRLIKPKLESHKRRISWVAPEKLHLTLKFLGSTPSEMIPRVIEAAQRSIAGFPSFEISVFGLGCFPRVLWLDILDGTKSLSQLERRMELEMEPLGFERENREFVPHLTLARVKEGRLFDPLLDVEQKAREWKEMRFGSCTIREMILFQSHTLKTGAVYEMISRLPLV